MQFKLSSLLYSGLCLISVLVSEVGAVPIDSDGLAKYIVIFEKGLDTPDSILRTAEHKLKEIGALITYEYNTVIKGFAVTAAPQVIEEFATSGNNPQYPFIVEIDKEVSTNN